MSDTNKTRMATFDRKPEMPEPEEHPLLKSLRELQPDELSPKDALEKLYQLKEMV